jgi:hypothetical protein
MKLVEAFMKDRVLSTRNNRKKGVMSYENAIVPLKIRENLNLPLRMRTVEDAIYFFSWLAQWTAP